jgi:hypothetical protein
MTLLIGIPALFQARRLQGFPPGFRRHTSIVPDMFLPRITFPFILLSATGLVFPPAPVRSNPVEDFNTWVHVSVTGTLFPDESSGSRWRYIIDSPNRFGNDARKYSQGVARAGLGYNLNSRWSVWAGYSYSHTDIPYTRVPFGEHRAFQQLLWTGRTGRFALGARLRLEERFPETGRDMGLRLRQQFRISHPVGRSTWLSWVVWDEVFLNLNRTDYGARRGLDQNRAFAGLGWKWSDTLRTEAGYMHHFNRRPGGAHRVNHVLAFSVALSFQ